MRNKHFSSPYIAAACWLLVIVFALNRVASPPAAPDVESEAGQRFALALEHITRIAAEKHPVGSAAHARVLDYLSDQLALRGLTFETQIVPVAGLSNAPRWGEGNNITNLMVRIAGREPGKALLVASHYDSAQDSFGAGDAGAAVASMLALLDTFGTPGTFRNDVIFLFTDGEEPCLCGARAFVTEHRWAQDVGMVLNFEARGSSGTSLMFETSAGNGELVRHYAAAARHPVTGSLYYEIYKVLPNNTDLTVFRVAGMPGINFAFIDDFRNYHTANDNLANLDRNTLFHHYTNMETMIRQFADADLDALEAPDVIFFDVLAFFVVAYPQAVAVLLTVLCAALFLLLVIAEFRVGNGGGARVRRLLIALLVLPVFVVAAGGLLGLLNGLLLPGATDPELRAVSTGKLRMLVFVLVVAGVHGFALRYARNHVSRTELMLPVTLLWLVLLVGVTIYLPGASYILMWPLLFLLLGMTLERYCAARSLPGNWRLPCRVLFPVPLLIIWTQFIYAIFLALTLTAGIVLGVVTLFGLALLSFYLLPETVPPAS